jgi:hypothetical protein
LLFGCAVLNKLCMPPQADAGEFNMEPCIACGTWRTPHTVTDKEKRRKNKKQLAAIAKLWEFYGENRPIKKVGETSV